MGAPMKRKSANEDKVVGIDFRVKERYPQRI